MTDAAPTTIGTALGWRRLCYHLRRHVTIVIGAVILIVLATASILAPWLVGDPITFNPIDRLRPPSAEFWFGTDQFGRNIFNRTVYGGQVSLIVGLSVAALSTALGLAIGLVSGYVRSVDLVIMRVMDGLLAIPHILLAIALMSLTHASVRNVIIAVTIAEVPRVVRLARGVVLTIRDQPYVDAAIAVGSSHLKIILRHILPNTLAPLIVQATFICASAIIIESALSFLGAGTPPEIPSWGNTIAEGRSYFQIAPWIILFPGTCLALLILSINLVGDGLRDMLDPRIARSL
jgi:peptide/nickel transport system permease protein